MERKSVGGGRVKTKKIVFLAGWFVAMTGMVVHALDTDGGGISDIFEEQFGAGVLNANDDPDQDGLSNQLEYYFGLNPIINNAGPVQFNLNESNEAEVAFYAPFGQRFQLERSTDLTSWSNAGSIYTGNNDVFTYTEDPDGIEKAFFRVHPLGALDTDSDGLDAWEEHFLGTNPASADSDGDGLNDGDEKIQGQDPTQFSGGVDPDHDGLTSQEEIEHGTGVNSADSDNDGTLDGEDGFAADPHLNPPRINTHYAVIPIGPASAYSTVRLVNDKGQAVLVSSAGNYYFWDAGTTTAIPLTIVTGLNNNGVVCGSTGTSPSSRASTWSVTGGLSQLGHYAPSGHGNPVNQYSAASDINDQGHVVGICYGGLEDDPEAVATGYHSGVKWTPSPSDLGTNISGVGGEYFMPAAINNQGMATGHIAGAAHVWQGGTVPLPAEGWESGGFSINNLAQPTIFGIDNDSDYVYWTRVGGQWVRKEFKLRVSGQAPETTLQNGTQINDRMEGTSGSLIWRNGLFQDIQPYVSGWNGIGCHAISDHGIIGGLATRTIDADGNAIPVSEQEPEVVVFLPYSVDFISRDPEAGDFENLGGQLEESDPRPLIELTTVQAQFLSNGDLQVSLQGKTRELLSEFLASGAGNVTSVKVYLDGELVDTISNLSNGSGSISPLVPWQRTDSTKTFSKTLNLSGVSPGVHSILVKTSANAAGNTGWDKASVLVTKQEYGDVIFSGAPSTDILLSASHTSSSEDSITLEVIGAQATVLEELDGQPASGIFTGQITLNGTPRNFTVKLPSVITLNSGTVENFSAEITYDDGTGGMITIYGEWEETGASTNRFHNGSQVATIESSANLVMDGVTSEAEESHQTFEPAVARITLPEGTEDWFGQSGWLQMELNGEQIDLESFEEVTPDEAPPQGMKHVFIAQNNEARTFLANDEVAETHYPEEVKNSGQFDVAIETATPGDTVHQRSHNVVQRIALDETIESSGGGGSSPSSSYNKADALLCFEIVFGQSGKNALTAFETAGLVVEEPTAFWIGDLRTYRFENLSENDMLAGRTPRLWLNKGRLKTAADASVALFNALQHLHEKAEGVTAISLRTDLVLAEWSQLWDSGDTAAAIAAWQNQNLKALEGTVVGLTEAMKAGMSFTLVGDAVVTSIDTQQQIIQGSAAGAAVIVGMALTPEVLEQLFKYMKRGGKSLVVDIPEVVSGSFDANAVEMVKIARGTDRRFERLRILRKGLQEGKISRQQMVDLYNLGFLKQKNKRDSLRPNLIDLKGQPPKNHAAHHDLPVAKNLEVNFIAAGLDPNDPLLGRFIPNEIHTKWSTSGIPDGGPFNKVWRDFFAEHPEASAQEILEELNKIRSGETKGVLLDGSEISFQYP
jgi:hypothetical protein